MFWVGLLIGGMVGMIVMSLCCISHESNKKMDDLKEDLKEDL